jgi:hypothetical protein
LHNDLNFHPYKIVTIQELNCRDMANRRISSKQLLETPNDDDAINALLVTDKAHCLLPGYMNKQNYRYWAAENPQELHQGPLHSDKLTVWCGIAAFGVLSPYVFEHNEGAAVTVWKCYATSANQSYVVVESVPLQYGSNKMGQQPIPQGHQ